MKIKRENHINEFNGYTEMEMNNLRSNKISIARSNEDIYNFVKYSKIVHGNFKIYLGKIQKKISDFIKNEMGINIENYNISLKTDNIRKVFKDHGSTKTENPRGQLPITEDDFINIPIIINNPDLIKSSGYTKDNKPAIKFEKKINQVNVIITYVSDKHNTLELQTMYKFKNK